MLKGVSPWLFLFAYHKHPICSLSLKEAVSNPHEICLAPLGIVGEHLRIVLQDVSSICKY